uniref:UDP-glucosyltransferase UGT79G2 n=1 Tax=Polygala tenuifolia TaxID=355332 RepID=A0A3G3NBG5_9FABA|nr:UDP-glucosyltransferase UGT79G2 [Polygala tenuifolia]
MGDAEAKFHVAMFPWLAMGHLTPYLHLSNHLASRGHCISFLLPRKAHSRLQQLNRYPDHITFRTLDIPHVHGLPQGTETASDVPLPQHHLLAEAMDLTRDQVESILNSTKPDFVFFDFADWLPQVARPLGIKSVCYQVITPAALAICLDPARRITKDPAVTLEELRQPPPAYPSSKVVFRDYEARKLSKNVTFHERCRSAVIQSDAVAIRTCQETEGKFCDYIASQCQKPVFLTGPVFPEYNAALEGRWRKWLDRFDDKSAVFCSFGSQNILEKNQFQEAVLGFELTGLPFLVSLKPPVGCATIEEALPEGFEERVKGRGIVYGGWFEQPLQSILNHPSVGCFVHHCGFGSMWESLASDCQIVLVPDHFDQILSSNLLAEELKVAVQVEREENGWFSKECLCNAIKSVMDEKSEVGSVVKKNHAEWRDRLTCPTFMSGYVDRFIQNLRDLATSKVG